MIATTHTDLFSPTMTAFSQHNCKDSTTGGTSSSIRQNGCCKALRRALGRFLASRQIAKKNNGQTVVSKISTTTTETSAHNNSKLQVYLLLGQSNMYGMGRVGVVDDTTPGTLDYAVRRKGLYPYLLSSRNDWTTLWSAVRNVHVITARDGKSLNAVRNEDLTIRNNTNIGPEVGIGHVLFGDAPGTNHNVLTTTNHNNNPVTQTLLLKSCIGNRSLGWDLLPPGSPSYEYNGQRYAAYGQSPAHWDVTDDNPTPTPGWYAGKQYDDDIHNARQVLKQLDVYVPNMPREAEVAIAGFFFWQGDKDRCGGRGWHGKMSWFVFLTTIVPLCSASHTDTMMVMLSCTSEIWFNLYGNCVATLTHPQHLLSWPRWDRRIATKPMTMPETPMIALFSMP